MLNTHLHFDHAGGNTFIAPDDPERRVQLTFPNAQYVVHGREYAWATHTNERTQASYLPHNFVPVAEAGKFRFLEGSGGEVVPGIEVIVTPGHVPWHMAVLIRSDGETLLFPADTIPTAHHLPLAWIMGYDVEPLRTLESKRALYARAVGEGWRVVFEHDYDTVGGRLVQGGARGSELGRTSDLGRIAARGPAHGSVDVPLTPRAAPVTRLLAIQADGDPVPPRASSRRRSGPESHKHPVLRDRGAPLRTPRQSAGCSCFQPFNQEWPTVLLRA